ncbi:zinc finger protein 69 homolog [Drosophila innubila]|uniref:zinc finger protein 69 homolog n=1 Tax=Drosophila innubila TaxID=198719 RepID=UPI00148CEC0A|nr:zinc finger protein 69 homolog [Drosophila innubila]
MENVCRVCARSNVSLMDIFSKFEKDGLRPADMLIECVDCNVHLDDPFPKKICLTCVVATQKAFKFKRTYDKSHQHFSQLLKINKCEDAESEEQTNTQSDSENGATEVAAVKEEESQVQETNVDMNVFLSEQHIKKETEATEEEPPCEEEESQLQEPSWLSDELIKNETLFNESNTTNQLHTHFCDTCGEGFPNNTSLILHSLNHYSRDHKQCPYCLKCYSSRSGLYHHVVVHSGEQPFKCSICPRSFTYNTQLEYHMRYHFGKRLKCPYCPMTFRKYEIIKKHMGLHSTDRHFECPHCQKRFIEELHLKNHMATHLIDRPFKCENCPKSFVNRGELNQHTRFRCDMPKKIDKEESCPIRTRFDTRAET